MVGELPDSTVDAIVTALAERNNAQNEPDEEAVSTGTVILARAGRLSLDQAIRATGGRLSIDAITALLLTLTDDEGEVLAEGALEGARSRANAVDRVIRFGTLREALHGTPWESAMADRLDTDVDSMDLEALTDDQCAAVVPFLSPPPSAHVYRRVLDGRRGIHPNDWAGRVAALAASAPTAFLNELLSSLAPSSPGARVTAVAALGTEIAARGDDTTAHIAWTEVLTIAERDLRPEFLEQLRAALPLAKRVFGDDLATTLRDAVQPIRTSFP